MKSSPLTAIMAVAVLLSTVSCSTSKAPSIEPGIPLDSIYCRDPFIVADAATKTYYLYRSATQEDGRGGVEAFSSKDLESWTGPETVFVAPEDNFINGSVWAPEVHHYNGSWYLFATLNTDRTWADKVEGWPAFTYRGTQIFKADSPLGPFKAISDGPQTPREWMALDGTLWVEDGRPYMIFCHEWVQVVDGSFELMPLTDDLAAPSGAPKTLFKASEAAWTSGVSNWKEADGTLRKAYVSDGNFLYRMDDGTLLMLWSSFKDGAYCIGTSRSLSGKIEGPWVCDEEPIFTGDGGHPMVFKGFDGELYITFHSPNSGFSTPQICLLKDTGNGLRVRREAPAFVRLLKEDITRAGCNTNCYEYGPVHDTKPPKGYKPFYISHYGRHGSRSNWAGKQNRDLIGFLTAAKEEDLLTASGDSLLAEVREVDRIHDGMNGRLTRIGCEEHEGIADRMYHRFPGIFKGKEVNIRSISSTVPRCIVSMTAFTGRLLALNPDLDIWWDTGETYMNYITNEPTNAIWRKSDSLRTILRREFPPLDTVQVMERLFKDPVAAKKHIPGVEQFERYIFEAGVVTDAFGLPPILRFLPFDAVYKWFEDLNMQLYLAQCNSKELGMERVPLTEPLVEDIVHKADEAIAGSGIDVDLRFGHDFPTLALVSYLGLEGPGDRLSAEEARTRWFGPREVCFAVNLQMIFYRDKGGDVLVKFLYNEKETLLRGLEPVEGPYYRWTTVKDNIKGYLR